MAKRQAKKTTQPTLRERVVKFAEARQRDIATYEKMDTQAAKGRVAVIHEVLADLGEPGKYRNTPHNRDKIRFLARQLAAKGSVPTHETATWTPDMYMSIAYKQLATQVEMLLKELPEEDEE